MSKAADMAEVVDVLEKAVKAMEYGVDSSSMGEYMDDFDYWRVGEGAEALEEAKTLLQKLRERGN